MEEFWGAGVGASAEKILKKKRYDVEWRISAHCTNTEGTQFLVYPPPVQISKLKEKKSTYKDHPKGLSRKRFKIKRVIIRFKIHVCPSNFRGSLNCLD